LLSRLIALEKQGKEQALTIPASVSSATSTDGLSRAVDGLLALENKRVDLEQYAQLVLDRLSSLERAGRRKEFAPLPAGAEAAAVDPELLIRVDAAEARLCTLEGQEKMEAENVIAVPGAVRAGVSAEGLSCSTDNAMPDLEHRKLTLDVCTQQLSARLSALEVKSQQQASSAPAAVSGLAFSVPSARADQELQTFAQWKAQQETVTTGAVPMPLASASATDDVPTTDCEVVQSESPTEASHASMTTKAFKEPVPLGRPTSFKMELQAALQVNDSLRSELGAAEPLRQQREQQIQAMTVEQSRLQAETREYKQQLQDAVKPEDHTAVKQKLEALTCDLETLRKTNVQQVNLYETAKQNVQALTLETSTLKANVQALTLQKAQSLTFERQDLRESRIAESVSLDEHEAVLQNMQGLTLECEALRNANIPQGATSSEMEAMRIQWEVTSAELEAMRGEMRILTSERTAVSKREQEHEKMKQLMQTLSAENVSLRKANSTQAENSAFSGNASYVSSSQLSPSTSKPQIESDAKRFSLAPSEVMSRSASTVQYFQPELQVESKRVSLSSRPGIAPSAFTGEPSLPGSSPLGGSLSARQGIAPPLFPGDRGLPGSSLLGVLLPARDGGLLGSPARGGSVVNGYSVRAVSPQSGAATLGSSSILRSNATLGSTVTPYQAAAGRQQLPPYMSGLQQHLQVASQRGGGSPSLLMKPRLQPRFVKGAAGT